MWGRLLLKKNNRARSAVAVAPPSENPVLGNYYRSALSPKGRRRLLTGFVILNFILGFFFAVLPDQSKAMLTIPLFVMAGLIVWLLPETGKPPTAFLTKMFFGYFIALLLWPYYLAIQLPGAPLIEIRRAFLFLGILAMLVSLSVSTKFIREMKEIMAAAPTFFKILFGLIIAQTLSVVGAEDMPGAFSAYMRIQLACSVMLFMAIFVLSKPGRVAYFANMIRVVAVALGIIAVLEYENQGILWANHIPSFLRVDDPAMTNLLDSAFRAGDYRVVGTFSVPLCYAEFMALTLPFFLHYILFGKNRLYKFILLGCDALVITAILLTQARVGIVGIMVTHGIYGFIWSIRFWRTNKDSLFGPALALTYPVGLVFFALAMTFIGRLRGMWMGGATEGASTLGRLAQAEKFPEVFVHRPLFGYGPSQGAKALNFRNPAGELSIDSGLLNIPLSYGAIGAALYFGMFIYMLIMGMKLAFNARDEEISHAMPAAVAVAFWLVSRIVLAQDDNSSFMYMMLATLVALSYQQKKYAAVESGTGGIMSLNVKPA